MSGNTGGVKIKESSSDLGIAIALLSSFFQKALSSKPLAIAEINLTGQIKPTNQAQIRINEAAKFGVNTILISANQKIKTSCNVLNLRNIYELLKLFNFFWNRGKTISEFVLKQENRKTLVDTRNELDYVFPKYSEMLEDQKIWMLSYSYLYQQYL